MKLLLTGWGTILFVLHEPNEGNYRNESKLVFFFLLFHTRKETVALADTYWAPKRYPHPTHLNPGPCMAAWKVCTQLRESCYARLGKWWKHCLWLQVFEALSTVYYFLQKLRVKGWSEECENCERPANLRKYFLLESVVKDCPLCQPH